MPIEFEPNRGQAPDHVRYLARVGSATLYFASDRVSIIQSGAESENVTFGFQGANPAAHIAGELPTGGRSNYFLTADRRKWLTGIPHFERLVYGELFPGIDVVFYSKSGTLEYDITVAPGADPQSVELFFDSPKRPALTKTGDIELQTTTRMVFHARPVAQQIATDGTVVVPCKYVRTPSDTFRLELAQYDKGRPLLIDPVVIFSTFLGGSGQNIPYGIVTDPTGNVIVTGSTANSINDFPITTNAAQTNSFVAKINSAGTKFVFSTYIVNTALAVATDSSGNVYVAGETTSNSSFPATPGAYQRTPSGAGDGFIMKLSPDGGSLLYATLFGGSGVDQARCLAIAQDGTAYISGYTDSTDLPLTSGAFQIKYGGGGDVFLAKISADGKSLLYSSYLGGTGRDQAYSIAVGQDGSAFVTGTASTDFPRSSGAYSNPDASSQFFIARLNPQGTSTSSLVYSAVISGGGASGIATDSIGNAYVVGSSSAGFSITSGTYFSTFLTIPAARLAARAGYGFVLKLSPDGSQLLYSMLIGGNASGGEASVVSTMASSVSVDGLGRTYVVGSTTDWTFPVTANALFSFPSELAGLGTGCCTGNGFLIELDATGTNLLYSTFLGSSISYFEPPVVSGGGRISIAGMTDSKLFPVSAGAVQGTYKGTPAPGLGNGFVMSLDLSSDLVPWIAGVASAATLTGDSVAPGEIITIKGHGIGPDSPTTATPIGNAYPTTLSGVTVLVDGVPAPILYADPNQINAIMPYGISGQSSTSVQVDNAGQQSNIWVLQVVSANPTPFMVGDPHLRNIAVFNADGTLMSAQHPCKKGACVFTIYFTGAGLTSPQDGNGQVNGLSPSKPALPVEVSVFTSDGSPVTIMYVGGAPLEVSGLIQLNIQVELCGNNLACTGPQGVQIAVGGHKSATYLFLGAESQ